MQQVFEGLESVSVGNCINCVDTGANDERSEKLKSLIRKYFQSVVDPTDDIIDAIEEEVCIPNNSQEWIHSLINIQFV